MGKRISNSKTKERNSAFTLIELLAVIVIIAVVALITVPLIINVIDRVRKGAFEDSAYGIIEAGKLYYMENITSKETADRYDFEVKEGKFSLKGDSTKQLKFTGTMPDTGTLQLHKNGNVAIAICNKTYCACKSVTELKVAIKDSNCNINADTGEIENTESVSDVKLKELEDKIIALEKKQVVVGSVISYIVGQSVPVGYLPCDGQVYNIKDYQELADAIKKGPGKYDYFGGDGTTTFAVPDLRGEFLRGTGTATLNRGTGEAVGVHQEPTTHANFRSYAESASGYFHIPINKNFNQGGANADLAQWATNEVFFRASEISGIAGTVTEYTSRPTNTAVLYCIKY